MGFTGFADISGRGQVILDGDPLIMRTFTRDEERESTINLFTMAGRSPSPSRITLTPSPTTRISSRTARCWPCAKKGLVGKPVFNNSHTLDYDPTARDPERWVGQLPDGSWAVALFNRSDVTVHQVDHLRRGPWFRPGIRPRCATCGRIRISGPMTGYQSDPGVPTRQCSCPSCPR